MKTIKYTLFTIMLFLICITNTYAACTQEDFDNFKKVEDEYTVKYEFDKNTKTYTLYFKVVKKDEYKFRINSNKKLECTELDNGITKCINLQSGDYLVEIIDSRGICKDVFKKINLKLPKYNKYSEDPLCKGIEEFVLCQLTYEKEIDYETFVSRVKTYKKTQEKKPSIQDEEITENKIIDEVTIYVKENIVQIMIIIVFLILLVITIVITAKSIRKSRRLE